MKIKVFQFEISFNKNDAGIGLPLLFLFLAWWEISNKLALIAVAVLYYLIFAAINYMSKIKAHFLRKKFERCPGCKSRHIVLQGYQNLSVTDEQIPFYYCTVCKKSSLMTLGGLRC